MDYDRHVSSDDGLEAVISLAAGVVASLSRGEALIDLLVVDGQVHPLTLGRSLGYLEQALDLLACVVPGARLQAAELVARLEPHIAQLSGVVLITEARADRGDLGHERQQLVELLETHGVRCKILRVARRAARDESFAPPERVVPFGDIAAEEPLWL